MARKGVFEITEIRAVFVRTRAIETIFGRGRSSGTSFTIGYKRK